MVSRSIILTHRTPSYPIIFAAGVMRIGISMSGVVCEAHIASYDSPCNRRRWQIRSVEIGCQMQCLAKEMRIGSTIMSYYLSAFTLLGQHLLPYHINYGRGTTLANPINAIASNPAVISAMGTPRNDCGTSSISRRSRIPAKSTNARAKPSAVATE